MKFIKFEKDFLYLVVPFIIIYIILSLIGVELLNKLFFATAYFWHHLLKHPNLKFRAESKRYQFAFLKLVYIFDRFLQKYVNKMNNFYLGMLLRLFQPFSLILMLVLFGGRGNILFSIAGSLIFEGINALLKKYFPSLQEVEEDGSSFQGFDI